MIATEEAPVQAPWKMPPVSLGQRVLFYRYGERDGKTPFMGYVLKVNNYTIFIKTVDGQPFSAVRHLDDPRLAESPDQRKDLGAWDYTDDWKEERLFRQEVRDRLSALEKQVNGLIAQSAKRKDAA